MPKCFSLRQPSNLSMHKTSEKSHVLKGQDLNTLITFTASSGLLKMKLPKDNISEPIIAKLDYQHLCFILF